MVFTLFKLDVFLDFTMVFTLLTLELYQVFMWCLHCLK